MGTIHKMIQTDLDVSYPQDLELFKEICAPALHGPSAPSVFQHECMHGRWKVAISGTSFGAIDNVVLN